MSLANSFGAFAQGLAGGKLAKDERKSRAADRELETRKLDLYEKSLSMPQENPYLQSSPQGGYGITPRSEMTQQSGTNSGLFGLIDATEGGGNYDTLFGHSQKSGPFAGTKVSEMTIGQLSDFASPSGQYGQWVKGKVGRVATPMGRHQIVGSTLRNAASQMGLSPDTVFSPDVQNSMAEHLASNRLKTAQSPDSKRAALRAEWEGFKNVSDSALDAAIAQFEARGMSMSSGALGISK